MSAKVHKTSCIELIRARQAKLVWIETIDPVATRLWRVFAAQRRERRPTGPWLQLDHLRGVNVLARVNFAEQLFARGGVEIQHGERGTAGLISAE